MLGLTNSDESSAPKPDKTLDAIGLMCPEPIFRTRIDIDKMVAGQVLEVLADDPAAEDDIKSWIKKSDNQLILVEKQGYTFRFLIRKVK
ncbi:MAG: sulfurtransferase TusA family protein [Thaumarchaeota archaeon]|nr:sulfurtransferase TusA family protein [Nitrososphaerota archaeon]